MGEKGLGYMGVVGLNYRELRVIWNFPWIVVILVEIMIMLPYMSTCGNFMSYMVQFPPFLSS